jgi:hypothetical protein
MDMLTGKSTHHILENISLLVQVCKIDESCKDTKTSKSISKVSELYEILVLKQIL